MTNGARIRKAREARGWNQSRLAVEAKVGIVTVSKIEQDKGNPTLDTLEKIGAALGLELKCSLVERKAAA
jgi:transcriptional regulator with XRE-family HTH domain